MLLNKQTKLAFKIPLTINQPYIYHTSSYENTKRSMLLIPEDSFYFTYHDQIFSSFRHAATGDSFSSLSFQYRMGITTISLIVPEVFNLIWEKMGPIYLKMPNSCDDWEEIAKSFLEITNFPHCIGALGRLHINQFFFIKSMI